jgi:hypothetical protein
MGQGSLPPLDPFACASFLVTDMEMIYCFYLEIKGYPLSIVNVKLFYSDIQLQPLNLPHQFLQLLNKSSYFLS